MPREHEKRISPLTTCFWALKYGGMGQGQNNTNHVIKYFPLKTTGIGRGGGRGKGGGGMA